MEDKRDEQGRWPPGTSGNPNGRPKKLRTLTSDLHRVLGEKATGDELLAMYEQLKIPEGLRAVIEDAENRQEAYALALVYRAMTGSWVGAEQIWGRTDPLPKGVQISGPGGGPIVAAGVALTSPISKEDAAGAYQDLLHNREPANDDDDT